MKNNVRIVISNSRLEALGVKYAIQSLPVIEWVCNQLLITPEMVDTSNMSNVSVEKEDDSTIYKLHSNHWALTILTKYMDLEYTVDDNDMEVLRKEVKPIIDFIGTKYEREQQPNK